MNNRDNFSKLTKQNLGSAVNWLCVKCTRPTRFPSFNGERQVNIGHAAHITAASPSGARYDVELTPEQRRGEENGAHLCPTCATVVDNDKEAFPTAMLQNLQAVAMERLRQLANQPVRNGTANTADVNRAVQAFLILCQRIRVNLAFDPVAIRVSRRDLGTVYDLLNACEWTLYADGWRPGPRWMAGQTYHAQDTRALIIQNNILLSMALLYKSVVTRGDGWQFDGHDAYVLEITEMDWTGRLTPEASEKIDYNAKLAHTRVSNFLNEVNNLRNYVAESNTFTSM